MFKLRILNVFRFNTTLELVDTQGNPRPWVCEPWFEAKDYGPRFMEHFRGLLTNVYVSDKPVTNMDRW